MSLVECTTQAQVMELARITAKRIREGRIVRKDKPAESAPVPKEAVEEPFVEPFMEIPRAAKIFKLSESRLREWCRVHGFGYKWFGRWCIPISKVEAKKAELKALAEACAAIPLPDDNDLRRKLHRVRVESRNADIVNNIKRLVGAFYLVSHSELIGQRRDDKFVRARHISIYLSSKLTGFSLPKLAEFFGDRDHTTILHAIRAIKRRQETDATLKADIDKFEAMVREAM